MRRAVLLLSSSILIFGCGGANDREVLATDSRPVEAEQRPAAEVDPAFVMPECNAGESMMSVSRLYAEGEDRVVSPAEAVGGVLRELGIELDQTAEQLSDRIDYDDQRRSGVLVLADDSYDAGAVLRLQLLGEAQWVVDSFEVCRSFGGRSPAQGS